MVSVYGKLSPQQVRSEFLKGVDDGRTLPSQSLPIVSVRDSVGDLCTESLSHSVSVHLTQDATDGIIARIGVQSVWREGIRVSHHRGRYQQRFQTTEGAALCQVPTRKSSDLRVRRTIGSATFA